MTQPTLTLTGVGDPEEIPLDDEIVIGRSVRSDVRIEGDLVSRLHARLYRSGGRWYVEDLGSRNGTLLNGVRITAAELTDGDVLNIGDGKFVFAWPDEPASSTFRVRFTEGEDHVTATAVSSEDAVDDLSVTAAVTYQDLVLANQRIATIVRISQRIGTLLDRDELPGEVMDTLLELFPQADRGAVVLAQGGEGEDGERMRVAATRGRSDGFGTHPVLNISRRLLQMVRTERRSVLSRNVVADSRFDGDQSMLVSAATSILCAPLVREDTFFGVIFLESLETPFEVDELNMLQAIAAPVAISLRNAQLLAQVEAETALRTNLSRYLSPDVVQRIGEGSLSANLGGETAQGTILFTDIVGFTALAEALAPRVVVERLNRYFHAMLEVLFNWRGTVDKFGGDAVLAVWGAPVANERHAHLACAAALEMQARLFELNRALEEAGEPRIRMAAGLNSGRFVAGNIGGAARMEWTVIGDTVNLAERVESLGFRGGVLASQDTLAELGDDAGGFVFEPVKVKGREQPVPVASLRVLRTHRGVVAAIPGDIVHGDGQSLRALLVRVHGKDKHRRVTARVAADVDVGETIAFASRLPEHPEPLRLTGRVVSSSPLLDSTTGRSLDMVVDEIAPELAQLLLADGLIPAPVPVGEIGR